MSSRCLLLLLLLLLSAFRLYFYWQTGRVTEPRTVSRSSTVKKEAKRRRRSQHPLLKFFAYLITFGFLTSIHATFLSPFNWPLYHPAPGTSGPGLEGNWPCLTKVRFHSRHRCRDKMHSTDAAADADTVGDDDDGDDAHKIFWPSARKEMNLGKTKVEKFGWSFSLQVFWVSTLRYIVVTFFIFHSPFFIYSFFVSKQHMTGWGWGAKLTGS